MRKILMILAFMLMSKSILDAHVTVRPGGTYTVDSFGDSKDIDGPTGIDLKNETKGLNGPSRPYPGELREKRKTFPFHREKNKKRKRGS